MTPTRYRDQAAACRYLAERAYSASLRDSYLRLAVSYDELADTAEPLLRARGRIVDAAAPSPAAGADS